jgi:hypothetical protein
MPNSYKHLVFTKEPVSNERRTQKRGIPKPERIDIRAHGEQLNGYFQAARAAAKQQISSFDGSYVLKIKYDGVIGFENLVAHGVEFISQEDDKLCIVFAGEQGMAVFIEHLERLGLNDADIKYKNILEAINGIDSWTAQDRQSWAVRNKGFPSTATFNLDIELWPVKFAMHPERKQRCTGFEQWLASEQIDVIDKINLDSLVMYRIIVNLTKTELLLNHSDIRMVDLVPDSGISYQQLSLDINQLPRDIPPPDIDAAKVCILDSGINTNHPLLQPAIAESASFVVGESEFDQAGHGTAVASIALYGDLEACNNGNYWKPLFWLYNGKVLDANANFDEQTIEHTIIAAVEHFVELGCRIFNLSIGNANAPYDGKHIRGISYVLDSLARQHNVLFVVSTGNFSGSEEPLVPRQSWRDEYPAYLLCDESVIIDPAPALNVLTVGSLAKHNATVNAQRYPEISQLSPAAEYQPSPFTRHGPSVNGALKPELMAVGGNLASPVRQEGEQWKADMRGLGVLACRHQFLGNTIFTEISGTSFATPYVTHLAGRLLNEYPTASANLLRALLVNHSDLQNECKNLFSESEIKAYKKEHSNREQIREIQGYGVVNEDTLYRSREDAVILICEETIENDTHEFFELPLPADFLRSNSDLREMRITLAHTPAVRTTRMDYKATRLSYKLVSGESLDSVQRKFDNATKDQFKETMGETRTANRDVSSEIRAKGTVQSSVWRVKELSPTDQWFVVVTRQDAPWGKELSKEQEPYALVVTVTDRENIFAQLYTQIELRLQERVRVRERT